jgi:hypothetical protein
MSTLQRSTTGCSVDYTENNSHPTQTDKIDVRDYLAKRIAMRALLNKTNTAKGSSGDGEGGLRRKAWNWAKQNVLDSRKDEENPKPQEESAAVETAQVGRHAGKGRSMKFEVSQSDDGSILSHHVSMMAVGVLSYP